MRQYLQQNARFTPVHYRDIARELGRSEASVIASLSIEGRQAAESGRPPYFIRTGPGLYRYNDLCEGAADEESIDQVMRTRAQEFNRATRNEMNRMISLLDLDAFESLTKIILVNIRAYSDEQSPDESKRLVVRQRHGDTVEMTTAWRDDGGCSPVVIYAKKCSLDEPIGPDTIRELRGTLPRYGANQGVLITNGIVTDEGRREAVGYSEDGLKLSIPPVHIMDKEIILNVLFESRTGIRTRNVELFLLDKDFFQQLRNYH
ncbi:MAG: restriction endonuclease [Candidatus Thorarchaeota archaeon]